MPAPPARTTARLGIARHHHRHRATARRRHRPLLQRRPAGRWRRSASLARARAAGDRRRRRRAPTTPRRRAALDRARGARGPRHPPGREPRRRGRARPPACTRPRRRSCSRSTPTTSRSPGRIARAADLLDADPDAVACVGDYEEFGNARDRRARCPTRLDPYRIAFTNEYPITSLFRRTRGRARRRLARPAARAPRLRGLEPVDGPRRATAQRIVHLRRRRSTAAACTRQGSTCRPAAATPSIYGRCGAAPAAVRRPAPSTAARSDALAPRKRRSTRCSTATAADQPRAAAIKP